MLVRVQNPQEKYNYNRDSCEGLVEYLEKENKEGVSQELWFDGERKDVSYEEVIHTLDNNRKGLKHIDTKFYEIHIDPSKKELEHMLLLANGDEDKFRDTFKDYVSKQVMLSYADAAAKRGKKDKAIDIKPDDLLWFGKVEKTRKYSWKDQEVKDGIKKKGELKEGLNWHCHVLVSRKTKDQKHQISPKSNEYGETVGMIDGEETYKGFSGNKFKLLCEKRFDEFYNYQRSLEESIEYMQARAKGDLEKMEELENKFREKNNNLDNKKVAELKEEILPLKKFLDSNEALDATKKYSLYDANGIEFKEKGNDLVISKKDEPDTNITIKNTSLNDFLGNEKGNNESVEIDYLYHKKLSEEEKGFIKEFAKPEKDRRYDRIVADQIKGDFMGMILDQKGREFLLQAKNYHHTKRLVREADKKKLPIVAKLNFLYQNGVLVKPIYENDNTNEKQIVGFIAGYWEGQSRCYAAVEKNLRIDLKRAGYGWNDYKHLQEQTKHPLYRPLVRINAGCLAGDRGKIKEAIDSIEKLDLPLYNRLANVWNEEKGKYTNWFNLDRLNKEVTDRILYSYPSLGIASFHKRDVERETDHSYRKERGESEKLIDLLFADQTDYAEEAQAQKRRKRKDKEQRRSRGKSIGL